MKNPKQKLFMLMVSVLCIALMAVSAVIIASAEDIPLGSSADNPYIATTAEELQQYIDSTDNEVNYISVRPDVMMLAVEQSIIQGAEDRPVVIDFSEAGIVEIADSGKLAFCNQATIIGGGAMFSGNEQAIYINTSTINTPVIFQGLYGNFNIHIENSPNVTIGDNTEIFYYDGTPLTVEGNSTVTATNIDLIGQTAAYSIDDYATLILDGTTVTGPATADKPQYKTNGIDIYFANVYDWGEVSPQLKNASSSGHGFTASKLNETDENGKELYYFTADTTDFETIRFYDSSYEGTGESNWMALAADGTVYYPTSDTYPCDLGTYKYSSLTGTGTQDDPFVVKNEEALCEALFDTTNTTTYIKLGASFGVTSNIEFDSYVKYNVSLDLNGYTLDMGENQIDVGYSTVLTITDTSSDKGKITGSGYQSMITANGDLIINAATIENTNGVAIGTTNNPDIFEIKDAYIIGGITHLALCTIDNSIIDGKDNPAISVGSTIVEDAMTCTVKNGSVLRSEDSYTVVMYKDLILENSTVEGGTTASIANYAGHLTVNNSTVGDIYNGGMSDGSARGVITVSGASSVGDVTLSVLSNTAAKFTMAGEAFDASTYIGSTVAVSLEGYTGDPITFYYSNKKNITEEQYDGLYAVYTDGADESKAVMASENMSFELDGGYFQLVAVHTHNYVAGATVDATLTTDGYTTYTCSSCGDIYNDVDEGSHAAVLKEYVDGIKANLEQADTNLQAAIDEKADASALADAIDKLTKAYEEADKELHETLSSEIDGEIAALKSELEGKLSEAKGTLQAAIDKVAADLEDAVDKLNEKDGELDGKIAALDDALDAADAAIRTDFVKADGELKADLEEQIKAAKDELQTAIDKVAADLKDAVDKLNEKDGELDEKIAAVDAAYQVADAALKSELVEKIDTDISALRAEMLAADEAILRIIEEFNNSMDETVENLKRAIAVNWADIVLLKVRLTDVQEALEKADALMQSNTKKLLEADSEITRQLGLLDAAYKKADEAIMEYAQAVEAKLNSAVSELNISIFQNKSDIEEKLAEVKTAYAAADIVINADITALKSADSEMLASIRSLTLATGEADEAIKDSVRQLSLRLDSAIEELNNAIYNCDTNLVAKITAAQKALEDADALIESDIVNAQSEDAAIKESMATLEAAYKNADAKLDESMQALEQRIAALEQRANATDEKGTGTDSSITGLIVAICIIGVISLAGAAVAVYGLFGKKTV